MPRNVFAEINAERRQSAPTRRPLIRRIERHLEGRALVTFFTSFKHPVSISDDDCDMLQSVLDNTDLRGGLALVVSSPGGNGLAAERIVNTCRAYSGTGDYWAIVPARAKSAATIICLGAAKILMMGSSELGPVDPQIIKLEGQARRVWSAHELVQGYEELFDGAAKTKGRLEPFLQQLQRYDHREIQQFKSAIALSEDIAVKILASGMMKGQKMDDIRKKIKVFTVPKAGTVVHGRAIFSQEAASCGLNIENFDINSRYWKDVYELYARMEAYVSGVACKAIESKQESFYVSAP
jgi:hypothetical protein